MQKEKWLSIRNKFIFISCYMWYSIIIILINPYINPDKYFVDSQKIFEGYTNSEFTLGDSYGSASLSYYPIFSLLSKIGIREYMTDYKGFNFYFINFLFYFLFFLNIIFFLIAIDNHSNSRKWLYSLFILLFFAPFYMGMPNKEAIPFLLFSFYLFLIKDYSTSIIKPLIFLFLIIAFYSFFFRKYFFLIFPLSIILYWIINKKFLYLKLLISIILGIIALFILFRSKYGTYFYYGRPIQLVEITNTWIHYYFDDFVYQGFLLNRIMAFFRILFPVELIFNLKYFPFVLWKIVISIFILRYLFLFKTLQDCKMVFLCCIFFSFLLVQALFEPDFGSVLRHTYSILPIVIFVYFRSHTHIHLSKSKINLSYFL